MYVLTCYVGWAVANLTGGKDLIQNQGTSVLDHLWIQTLLCLPSFPDLF